VGDSCVWYSFFRKHWFYFLKKTLLRMTFCWLKQLFIQTHKLVAKILITRLLLFITLTILSQCQHMMFFTLFQTITDKNFSVTELEVIIWHLCTSNYLIIWTDLYFSYSKKTFNWFVLDLRLEFTRNKVIHFEDLNTKQ
jgi:hypothetical protein